MSDDLVTCSRCSGSGRAPLTPHLARALEAARVLARAGEDITAENLRGVIKERLPLKHTAACNRLAALEQHGFMRRYGRVGRVLVYELREARA